MEKPKTHRAHHTHTEKRGRAPVGRIRIIHTRRRQAPLQQPSIPDHPRGLEKPRPPARSNTPHRPTAPRSPPTYRITMSSHAANPADHGRRAPHACGGRHDTAHYESSRTATEPWGGQWAYAIEREKYPRRREKRRLHAGHYTGHAARGDQKGQWDERDGHGTTDHAYREPAPTGHKNGPH